MELSGKMGCLETKEGGLFLLVPFTLRSSLVTLACGERSVNGTRTQAKRLSESDDRLIWGNSEMVVSEFSSTIRAENKNTNSRRGGL